MKRDHPIEVNRRKLRAKTDRIDAGNLVGMLIHYDNGETKEWSVVRVPTSWSANCWPSNTKGKTVCARPSRGTKMRGLKEADWWPTCN